MSKLPRLPQYALLEEIAAWLTAASEEEWTARSVLSRLLEEHRYLTAEGAAGSSRVWGPDEVWVVLHRGDVLIDALNGKEWVLPFSRKLMVLEPIDQFIRDLCDAGAATATSGLTDQGRQRYRARRCFCPSDVMLPREVAETLLSDFDRLILEVDRGEHKDLVALLDRAVPLALNSAGGRYRTAVSFGRDDISLSRQSVYALRNEHESLRPNDPKASASSSLQGDELPTAPTPEPPARADAEPAPEDAQICDEGGAPNSTRTRYDDIQIEIDDVIAGLKKRGERPILSRVMALLKDRAGRPNSCISEAFEGGVMWIRGSNGRPEKLTNSILKSRMHRSKQR